LTEQALALSTDGEIAERMPEARLLAAKLAFVQGEPAAAEEELARLAAEAPDAAGQAAVHYEWWSLSGEEEHRQAALELYRGLAAESPRFVYRQRLGELMQGGKPA
jgi:hypothetical protein